MAINTENTENIENTENFENDENLTSNMKKSPSKRKNDLQEDNSKDTNKSPKRRRDADQQILDEFWVICEPNAYKRNKSIKTILDILIKQNESNGSTDLMYCLDRVIRGMASARQFARHGFCVLLTQILTIFESKVSLELVLELSEKHLGKIEELSNHDSVIGWSLVMASVIKSQRLTQCDEHIYGQIFNILFTLGMKKSYIELVVAQLFTQFLDVMTGKGSLLEKIIEPKIESELKTENKYKLFFAFVCLSISEHFPKISKKKKLFYFNCFTGNDSFAKLPNMIKESTSYHPSVHPFNQLIIKAFISSENKFQKFWNQCIDEVLFTPNQIEKGFLGFELTKIGLQFSKSVEDISTILSPSFVRLFIQSLSSKTHVLYSASQQLSLFLVNFIKTIEDSELQLQIMDNFTKEPGSLLFDDISKSKFFTNLSRNLNSTSIEKWTQKLREILLTTNKIESNDILRIRCIQKISNICKSLKTGDETILWTNLKFLFFQSYFETLNSKTDEMMSRPAIPYTDKVQSSLKDGFRNIFNTLLHLNIINRREKLTHEMKTLSSMVTFINELLSDTSIKCLTDFNFSESFRTIVGRVQRLNKKLKPNSPKEIELKIFISLYSMLAIQLFEDNEDFQNIIVDLDECSERSIDNESNQDNSSPFWADVLTDLIISMLTMASKWSKSILFSCFRNIRSHITRSGLQRLVDAINPSNDNNLFDGNENDSDEDEIEGQEESVEEKEENEESGPDSDSEEEEEIDGEIDEKFRNDIINALGPAAHNDDDEESVYLSDSEMFQIDESLAAVFKTKYTDKKEAEDKRNSIFLFRIRCLDLIEDLLNQKDISLDQVLVFIEPLVSLAKSLSQSSKQNQLSTKAIQMIYQISKIKVTDNNSIELKELKHIFNNLLTNLSKIIHLEMQKALTPLIIWFITLSKKLFPNDEWYSTDIESALKAFFEKNNCQIPTLFFNKLFSVHYDIGFKLHLLICEYAFNESLRPFKRSAAVEVLLILYKIKTPDNSNVNSISNEQKISIRDKCVKELSTQLMAENLKSQFVKELLQLFSSFENNLKDQNPELKLSKEVYQELTSKLSALSKQKRKKLNANSIIKKIFLGAN